MIFLAMVYPRTLKCYPVFSPKFYKPNVNTRCF